MTTAGDDMLARATRALRDESERPARAAAGDAVEAWQGMRGWHDVSRDVRRAARRRRVTMIIGLQAALALGGVGAWAAVSGRLPALFAPRAPAPAARRAPAAARPHRGAPRAPELAPAPPPPLPAPIEAAAPAPPRATASLGVAASRAVAVARPRPAAAPPVSDAVDDAAEALYREAHLAHFVQRDYLTALRAWDRYLATGARTLAPEAGYNRAIALIRLGRRDEAATALRPFAEGAHGSYRQQEARALLGALAGGAPPGE